MSIFNEFEAHLKAEVIKILGELDLYHPPAPELPTAATPEATPAPDSTPKPL